MNIINSRFGVNSSIQHQNKKSDIITKSNDESVPSVKKGSQSNIKEAVPSRNCRVDKIELSHKISNNSNSFDISKLKSKITTDIKAESSPDRIQRISQKISNNEYIINAKELASIILKI